MTAILAGCGSPSASLPAPSASTNPTATPGPAGIVDAFLRETSDPGRSFSMTLTGDVSASGMGAQVDIAADVQGSDFRMTNTIGSLVWESIKVGDATWDRVGDGDWSSGRHTPLPDPFLGLTSAGVSYLRPEGASHRLSAGSPQAILDILWSGMFDDPDTTTASFEVLVEDRGVPVEADIEVVGTVPERQGEFRVSLHYTFQRWGEAIHIELPR